MITIKELADILGMSTTTVSNVIHGKTKEVSEETCKIVEKALEKYNYVPNMNARNLASRSSKIIGVAIKELHGKYKNVLADQYMGELAGAIEKELRRKDYFMIIYISDNVLEIVKQVSSWTFDGLILCNVSTEDAGIVCDKIKKPSAFIDVYLEEFGSNFINIGLEDEEGLYKVTKYLIQCGHTHIAFIADNDAGVDHYRYLGYKRAMLEEGLYQSEEAHIIVNPAENWMEQVAVLTSAKGGKYTALAYASDYYAVTSMNYMMDAGMKIPEDISVTGFDDNNLSKLIRPKLTTVHQDVEQKAIVAVKQLLNMIKGYPTERKEYIVPVSIVIRDSVAVLKNNR